MRSRGALPPKPGGDSGDNAYMSLISKLRAAVDPRLSQDTTLKDDLRNMGRILRNPFTALDTKEERKTARDSVFNLSGAAVGYSELLGIRYPVKQYQQKVSDGLWRGSRVDAAGVAALKQQGIQSIVSLTAEGTKDEGPAKQLGMGYLQVKIIDNTAPTFGQMKQFLDFVTAPQNQPSYVHCEAGKGRTGVAVACYRMAVQGWSPEQALAEAVHQGMSIPDQQAFVLQFGEALKQGKIDGYPLAAAAGRNAA